MTDWSLDAATGELRIRTGVGGPAAKMGHRLTIGMQSWAATVHWDGAQPKSVELTVEVDSLQVLSGEGGITPLSAPERMVARANALKSLDAKKYPRIRFVSDEVGKTADGYRITGTVEIHGRQQTQEVGLAVEDRGDSWAMSTQVAVMQSEFGVKPYSLLMGSLKVADEVTIDFSATHPK